VSRKPPAQAESLFDANGVMPGGRRRIGRVERRTTEAIRLAKKRGEIEDLEDPLAIAAIVLAESMDRAARTKPDPYAVVAASRELREVLAALGLTSSTTAPDDELLAELRKLGEAE
jgi:hypothetical protein